MNAAVPSANLLSANGLLCAHYDAAGQRVSFSRPEEVRQIRSARHARR